MVQLIELGNRVLLGILQYFVRNPLSRITYTNLRNKLKIAKATITKHLNFLLENEFIKVEKIGLNKIYFLNTENFIVKQLKILDNLLLLNEIKILGKKYEVEIFLYGSAARGEDTEKSDIDLLIIGKVNKETIIQDIEKISKRIEREIKFTIFTPLEWSGVARKDVPFYERVEKDKIRLY